ncbi:ABC transporter substrate-binding protein [Gracilibacillus phocaeensis]|uniref:ABC transporter substrate-binding protein n=1 Tax=Gracilibacillus phocaeensis TaxID=2042304 RepID=UPI001030770C|nr:extracellular solute-binding protein [Gracilibacillus phocaeensis]
MKMLLRLLLSTVILLTIAACGSNDNSNGDGSNSGDSADEKTTVVFMSRNSGADPMAEVYEKQIDEFMKKNPDIEVQNDSVFEESAYNNKLKVSISTGDTPSVFYYPGIAGLKEWAENDVILNVEDILANDEEWSSRFIDGALETYRLDDYGVEGIYGIPNELNVDAIFYNKKLFEQAGITEEPKTMDEFYEAMDKLNSADITPIGVGGKATWVMGHIFNNILYKQIGIDGVTQLGIGEKKWTDPDVVEALRITKELKDKEAFAEGFEGMDFNTQMNQFLTGEAAMISHSSPVISESIHSSESEFKEDFSFFPFPYFSDKSEYEDTHVVYTSNLLLSGTMDEAEEEAAIKFVKYLTTNEAIQERMDVMRVSPYKDIEPSSEAPQIFKDMIDFTNTLSETGGEYFDYSPSASLVNTSRNAILDMMLSASPEETAQRIQDSLDSE